MQTHTRFESFPAAMATISQCVLNGRGDDTVWNNTSLGVADRSAFYSAYNRSKRHNVHCTKHAVPQTLVPKTNSRILSVAYTIVGPRLSNDRNLLIREITFVHNSAVSFVKYYCCYYTTVCRRCF